MPTAQDETPPFILLRLFADLAERGSAQMPVTLLVDGAWISGLVLGQRDFLDRMAVSLDRVAGPTETAAALVEPLKRIFDERIDFLVRRREEEKLAGTALYLGDAAVWHPTGGECREIGEVVVRYDRVSAYYIGGPDDDGPDGQVSPRSGP